MNNCKNLSAINYSNPCENCGKNCVSNIDIPDYHEGTVIDKTAFSALLFFVVEGRVEVSCGSASKRTVEKNFFFLIPSETRYSIRFPETGKVVFFCPGEELIVEYLFKNLCEFYKTKRLQCENSDIYTLEIEQHVGYSLTDFMRVKDSGLSCMEYVKCKSEELMILLLNYYSGEDLACLFHPVFKGNVAFKTIILRNKNRLFTVEEFVSATHLNRDIFRLRFKEIFGMTPTKWIQRERAYSIFRELTDINKPIDYIIENYGFSNYPCFVRFCNKHFKKTPALIRKEQIK
jgi:AraC-like DNA-binding protein